MGIDLKSCPFCGSKCLNYDSHSILCSGCRAYVSRNSLEEAAKAWNTRCLDAAIERAANTDAIEKLVEKNFGILINQIPRRLFARDVAAHIRKEFGKEGK